MLNPEPPRMQSLRDQIHQILMQNLTPLQQKLRNKNLSNSSIQQLFDVLAQQYNQKQNQVSTIGKLVLYTIDLLTQQVNEKNQLTKQYESVIEEYKIEQEDNNIHIEQCEAALEDYKEKIDELELELGETRELRERYQIMYEEEISSKSTIDIFDSSKQGESMDAERSERMEEEKERYKMEIGLLDYQIKQLKLEIGRKDALILQKEQHRSHLNQRFKGEVTKNQTLQGNFRVLQENFRSIVVENDNLRKIVEELEQKERDLFEEKEKERERNRNKQKVKGLERRVDSTDKLKEKSSATKNQFQLKDSGSESNLRRSVSQSIVRRKVSDIPAPIPPLPQHHQPKNSLAFDLQSLQSGTSMLSPLASEIGKPNIYSFFPMHHHTSRFAKQRTPRSSRVVVKQRKISRSPSEVSVSPRKVVTARKRREIRAVETRTRLRVWVETVLQFLVSDRIRKN